MNQRTRRPNTQAFRGEDPGLLQGPQSLELDTQMLHKDFILSSVDRLCHMENLQLWEHKPTKKKISLFPQLRFTSSPRTDLV